VSDATTQRRLRAQEFIDEAKRGGCVDCGVVPKDLRQLHFDHIDPAQKALNIGSSHLVARERLIAEIAKCEVRCVACHQTVTAHQHAYGPALPHHSNVVGRVSAEPLADHQESRRRKRRNNNLRKSCIFFMMDFVNPD
jgi:hypothetical protein